MIANQHVLYYQNAQVFVLKFEGALRFHSAPSVSKGLNQISMLPDDYQIILDMTQAQYLDSTVLGTIASYFCNNRKKYHDQYIIPKVVCENKNIKKLLEKIGLENFIEYENSDHALPADIHEYIEIEADEADLPILQHQVLKAHEVLNALNKDDSDHQLVIKTLQNGSKKS